jgi:hypothetical protein
MQDYLVQVDLTLLVCHFGQKAEINQACSRGDGSPSCFKRGDRSRQPYRSVSAKIVGFPGDTFRSRPLPSMRRLMSSISGSSRNRLGRCQKTRSRAVPTKDPSATWGVVASAVSPRKARHCLSVELSVRHHENGGRQVVSFYPLFTSKPAKAACLYFRNLRLID